MKDYLIKWQYNFMDFIGEKMIFNNNPPDIGRFIANIPYVDEPDNIRLLDILVPDGKGMFPIIIYIHGGGWISGDKRFIYCVTIIGCSYFGIFLKFVINNCKN